MVLRLERSGSASVMGWSLGRDGVTVDVFSRAPSMYRVLERSVGLIMPVAK